MRIWRFFGVLACLVVAAAPAGCSNDLIYTDAGADNGGGTDLAVPDQGVDSTSDSYVFPDFGGNGMVSVSQPSAELSLRIVTPSNRGFAATQGGTVALAGIMFGQFESIHFEMAGVNDGQVIWTDDSPYWQTEVIQLSRGDNRIVVKATGRGEADDPEAPAVTVSDEIVVTYNPAFYFPAPLRMNPPTVFVGRTQAALAEIDMGMFGKSVGDLMYVVRQESDGSIGPSLGVMLDKGMFDGNGKASGSADEISGDGVFTARVMVKCDKVGTQIYRAAFDVTNSNGTYTALSAPFELGCINAISRETCTSHQDTLMKARKAFYARVDAGLPDAAIPAALTVLDADSSVVERWDDDDLGGGLWVRFDDGVMGALNLSRAGGRGDGDADGLAVVLNAAPPEDDSIQIPSRETVLLSPFFTEFGHEDEIQKVSEIASQINCPSFTVKGPYNGSGASLERFRQLHTSGIIGISTHSDVYFRSLSDQARDALPWRHRQGQEVLWSGESINCGRISSSDEECTSSSQCPAGSSCVITEPSEAYIEQVVTDAGVEEVTKYTKPSGTCFDQTHSDLMAGRVVMGDRTWGVTPEFIEYYSDEQPFPGSVVYLGGCRTLYNGTLATALIASGARTVMGYSNRVTSKFASQAGYNFFFNLMMKTLNTSESWAGGAADPDNPGSFFRLFGALNMTAKGIEILNPGFETSDASAWVTEGDGRVISRLGETTPIAGKFMGIISTGLGFTDKTGVISQSFCIPAGATELVFYWKYYSEEFHEFCGTAYQDAFQAKLSTRDGTEYPVVDIKVDDLCAVDDGKCQEGQCGSKYVGLEPSDIDFDRGDTHMTSWQKASFPLTMFDTERDAPVTISFFCTDKGDSIFDTAVLVDSVSFR
ncbi:MAG TPA: hypothetical protein PLY68_04465 [Myxococcota bacterium]|nr:hypothetical protein [Myxococcota bacterium]HPB50350.1 hypothetical protein [Myxococcota bacterium]HQP95432.1 hypothetical protein [Myxococcota bacterium]